MRRTAPRRAALEAAAFTGRVSLSRLRVAPALAFVGRDYDADGVDRADGDDDGDGHRGRRR